MNMAVSQGCTGVEKSDRGWRITQEFASYHADTEQLTRTPKEELVWLHEWTSPLEWEQALAPWINQKRNTDTTGYGHTVPGRTTPHRQYSVRCCLTKRGEHYRILY